ncbi:hypothetical protein AMJ85_00910 [candidate division BRC1 bacterium SM23_51]|nr:MAG: hypothetical protein AMJ85_00910 [candidate division BRC1 bacterium SM23_51]
MFRVFVEPKSLVIVVSVVLVVWAISDCVRRRHHPFWIVIIVLFWYLVGPLLYFAWTRNWIGQFTHASEAARARSGGPRVAWDSAGEGTPAALQKRGAQLLRRGRYKEAIEVLEGLLEREGPTTPLEVRYDIALAYKALERYRDARDQLSLVVGQDPKFRTGRAFLDLADCHFQMDDEQQAMNLFQQLLRVIRFPEARYKYGILLDRAGKAAAAAEQMRLLIGELDTAPEFHRHNNRRFARLAKKYLRAHG